MKFKAGYIVVGLLVIVLIYVLMKGGGQAQTPTTTGSSSLSDALSYLEEETSGADCKKECKKICKAAGCKNKLFGNDPFGRCKDECGKRCVNGQPDWQSAGVNMHC